MESKTKLPTIIWGGWDDRLKNNDDDGHVEFSLDDWEPEGLVVEFEPDEELQLELDLDEDEVIEIELEPLQN